MFLKFYIFLTFNEQDVQL